MPMLAELVEVVIGVDTHADTHSAAVLDVRTGGVLARSRSAPTSTATPRWSAWPRPTPGCVPGRWKELAGMEPA